MNDQAIFAAFAALALCELAAVWFGCWHLAAALFCVGGVVPIVVALCIYGYYDTLPYVFVAACEVQAPAAALAILMRLWPGFLMSERVSLHVASVLRALREYPDSFTIAERGLWHEPTKVLIDRGGSYYRRIEGPYGLFERVPTTDTDALVLRDVVRRGLIERSSQPVPDSFDTWMREGL